MDFNCGFLDGVFIVSVLECKGVLKMTCLNSGLFVMESTTLWELALFGYLKSNNSQVDICRVGQQGKGPCGVLKHVE